jgi:hypothetical protein
MNATKTNTGTDEKRGLAATCLKGCRKLVAQLAKAKEALFTEFGYAMRGNERLLQLALGEAEALAWQTDFPHLVFPTLAMEKAQAVASWQAHQRSVQRRNSPLAFVA